MMTHAVSKFIVMTRGFFKTSLLCLSDHEITVFSFIQ